MTNFVDPTREQFGAFMKAPDNEPIHMLNLIKLRDEAAYPDGRKATGKDAYETYGKETGPIFERVGGEIAYSWDPIINLIGPTDEGWDIAFVAQYPNAAAFAEMVKDPDYQKAVVHRQAAVLTSRLVRMHPRDPGAGFG
ncbi:MAG: DUF1330 domain-containing protein [Marinicaulis sp.]|nr:DUF1330 domain-containing protein [Marinicaulis sp.]NNE42487.1 DUF1330 domain-containing protein [Marinicaulis sp.]NNL90233.1 DUF1330 domain-containing protein [Marinicaulis sp.]